MIARESWGARPKDKVDSGFVNRDRSSWPFERPCTQHDEAQAFIPASSLRSKSEGPLSVLPKRLEKTTGAGSQPHQYHAHSPMDAMSKRPLLAGCSHPWLVALGRNLSVVAPGSWPIPSSKARYELYQTCRR